MIYITFKPRFFNKFLNFDACLSIGTKSKIAIVLSYSWKSGYSKSVLTPGIIYYSAKILLIYSSPMTFSYS